MTKMRTLEAAYKLYQLGTPDAIAEAKDGLHLYFKETFGRNIPRVRTCANHTAPFDVFADMFFERISNGLLKANRSGGKTSISADLLYANSIAKPGCESANAGAIQEQAKKCYRYFDKLCHTDREAVGILGDSLISRTDFKTGSLVEILSGTIRGLNSPHPHKFHFDEVELSDWASLQEAFSMARSSKKIKGQNFITSTQKYAQGVMGRLINEATERDLKVYTFCIWETIEQIPEDRKEEFRRIFPEAPEEVYTKKDSGFISIDDAIRAKRNLDPEVWEAQWLCLRPERTGLVYPFENIEGLNLIDSKKFELDKYAPVYIAEDFGYSEDHPDAILLVQVNSGKQMVVFDEIYSRGKSWREIEPEVVRHLDEWGSKSGRDLRISTLEGWFPDPADPAEIDDRIHSGARVQTQTDPEMRKIDNGIPIVRRLIIDRQVKVVSHCTELIGELLSYHYRRNADGTYADVPDKKFDHGPDALRYLIVNLFPLGASGGLSDNMSKKDETITGGVLSEVF